MDHHDTPPFCILRKGWMSVLLCSLTAPCVMNERTQWAIKYALKLRRGAAYRIPLAHPQWKLRHANPCYFRKVGEKGHLHFGIFCCIFAQANVKVSLPEAFFFAPKGGFTVWATVKTVAQTVNSVAQTVFRVAQVVLTEACRCALVTYPPLNFPKNLSGKSGRDRKRSCKT